MSTILQVVDELYWAAANFDKTVHEGISENLRETQKQVRFPRNCLSAHIFLTQVVELLLNLTARLVSARFVVSIAIS